MSLRALKFMCRCRYNFYKCFTKVFNMNCQEIFKGKVKIKSKKKLLRALKFDFDFTNYDLEEVMMCNFENLKLCQEEKHELSQTHRQIIKNYQKIDEEYLVKSAKQLTKIINELKHDQIDIEATDAGTFICLAAIFSGKLNIEKDINFHLDSAPINLFKKRFVHNKNAMKSVNVNLNDEQESWLRSFSSLKKAPSFMEIRSTHRVPLAA